MKFYISLKRRFGNSAFWRAFELLPRADRVKVGYITLIQTFMGVLDLTGVIVIGAIGALSIQGLESKNPGNKVGHLLRLLHFNHLTFRNQITCLALLATFVLITKTLMTIYFVRKTFYFLSFKGSEISANLIEKVLSQNLTELQKRSSQTILFTVSDGVKNLMVGILGTILNMASDFSTLIIMAGGLLFVDPIIALATAIIFSGIGYSLHRLLQVRAQEVGSEFSDLTIKSNEKILEVLNSYRESVVRNRRKFYAEEIRKIRYALGKVTAEMNFQPYISKYVLESASVIGILVLGAFEFATKNAVHAVSTLTVFIAASSRIAPGALRIQQGFLQIRNSVGTTQQTFDLIHDLHSQNNISDLVLEPTFNYQGFEPSIVLSAVSFKYPGRNHLAIKNIDLNIPAGSSIALVGPSGAGKTTLVDLILGVLEPSKGTVKIGGVIPSLASKSYPGGMSYTPQDVFISNGSIRQNVALGYKSDSMTDERVWKALGIAQLSETVLALEEGIDSSVGERGSLISGGQRQRLGIARALFTEPKLLVLDEATSALDGQSEAEISDAIKKLSGEVTVVVVAHRLSTVRAVDKLVYIDNGEVLATGSFEEVRKAIPDFDKQATLMGL